MKNLKKIVSLILAVCMIASFAVVASAAEPNTVSASGGTGTSSVTLSSTADGSLNGDPAATKMSVTVPTVLPIAVGTDGTVSTATDAKIVNNSFGAVKVNSVSIEAAQGWSLAAFGDKAIYPYEEMVAIVANDEGILLGMDFNRSVEGGYGGVFGPFFVCGLTEDDFCSLSPDQMERFKKKFHKAELLLGVRGNDLVTLKVEPKPKIPKPEQAKKPPTKER